MTPHERQRFAALPACDDCEHPTGHHTRRGCAWCDCGEVPSFASTHPGTIYETAAGGIYRTADDYLVTPSALLAMGVRPVAVGEVVQRCHDAAGLPHVADCVLRERA